MAYAKAQFEDLQLSLAYRYGESAVPSGGVDNRNYWLNRGVNYVLDKLKPTQVDTITIASGICDLSSTGSGSTKDFRSFVKLLDANNHSISLVSQEDYAHETGNVCSITGNHSSGFTLKVKTDGAYTLWYRFYPSDMVNATDECIVSDPEAVVAYAYAQLRRSETDPLEDADRNMQECDDRIVNMSEEIARNEGTLSFKTLY